MKRPQPRSAGAAGCYGWYLSYCWFTSTVSNCATHRIAYISIPRSLIMIEWIIDFNIPNFCLLQPCIHFRAFRIRENIYYCQFNNPSFLQAVFCLHRNYDLSWVWFMSGNLAAPYHSMCSLVFIKYSRGYVWLYSISSARRCIDAAVTIYWDINNAILVIPAPFLELNVDAFHSFWSATAATLLFRRLWWELIVYCFVPPCPGSAHTNAVNIYLWLRFYYFADSCNLWRRSIAYEYSVPQGIVNIKLIIMCIELK